MNVNNNPRECSRAHTLPMPEHTHNVFCNYSLPLLAKFGMTKFVLKSSVVNEQLIKTFPLLLVSPVDSMRIFFDGEPTSTRVSDCTSSISKWRIHVVQYHAPWQTLKLCSCSWTRTLITPKMRNWQFRMTTRTNLKGHSKTEHLTTLSLNGLKDSLFPLVTPFTHCLSVSAIRTS